MLNVSQSDFDAIGKSLSAYYEKSMAAGVHVLLDRMRTRDWGVISSAYVQKSDLVERTWNDFHAKSNDTFSVPFEARLKQSLAEYCGNTADMQRLILKGVAAAAKEALALIPIPGAKYLKNLVEGSVKLAGLAIGKGAELTDGYLHGESISEADAVVASHGNKDLAVLFRDDREAMAAAEAALEQYKHIANLIKSMPENITNLNDAVLYPGVAAKIRMAASDLRQQLVKVNVYVASMQMRVERVAETMHKDSDAIAAQMSVISKNVVTNAYYTALADAKQQLIGAPNSKSYQLSSRPSRKPLLPSDGGATQLADLVAYALAQGHYDAFEISSPTFTVADFYVPVTRSRR